MPEGIADRNADCCEALLAIADLKWLIRKMASLPITRQDWAFVFEVSREEATKVAWKVDANAFGKLEQAPSAFRVVKWFMESHTKS